MSATGPSAWLLRCRSNIQEFRNTRHLMTPDQQIQFIREQYAILAVIRKVINGEARLQGISQP